ncbi:MAG TPA: tRNA (adenosine(37)-N6)-threonylcarbamoyltransferase complex dimerization subunit type 1 TsaB [Planctomycetaceae bacterium]|nr:tRNA (adenosine(37)-N6)-threonylcarbamoyltransferase complex dimerization subunit type 1 TsaB [Planctomycetaceae bacterium]
MSGKTGWTLGIETSTREGGIALAFAGEIRESRSLGPVSQRHAQTLFVEIDRLTRQHGLKPSDLSCVAVSIGPGSFTGLRIGVVAAKTLAYALKCELKPIDTFLAVAERSPIEVTSVTVIGDAQRGGLFVGRYRRDEHANWHRESEIEIVDLAEFLAGLSETETVSGPGVTRYEQEIGKQCHLTEPNLRMPVAEAVCRLASREDIASTDFWSLEPFYLRKSAAEEKWEQTHSD